MLTAEDRRRNQELKDAHQRLEDAHAELRTSYWHLRRLQEVLGLRVPPGQQVRGPGQPRQPRAHEHTRQQVAVRVREQCTQGHRVGAFVHRILGELHAAGVAVAH